MGRTCVSHLARRNVRSGLSTVLCIAGALITPSPALACRAWDVGCEAKKAVTKPREAVRGLLPNVGQTGEKALHDSGKAIENAGHDTGHALEKAGQDAGKVFKKLVDFSLSCSIPPTKPAALQENYQSACASRFDTYGRDIDVCNQAGGVSVIAAGTAGALLSPVGAGAATYALAKIAFELCETACTSQRKVKQCISDVDTYPVRMEQQAQAEATRNAAQEKQLVLFACIDDAYNAQKFLVLDSILAECEGDKNCNTTSKEFADKYLREGNRAMKNIDTRRQDALQKIKGSSKAKLDYGPFINGGKLSAISLASAHDPSKMICRVTRPNIILRATVNIPSVKELKVQLLRDGDPQFHTNATVSVDKSITLPISLKDRGVGNWEIQILSQKGEPVGSFGFVYRLEP